jgi:hypothetical protein
LVFGKEEGHGGPAPLLLIHIAPALATIAGRILTMP